MKLKAIGTDISQLCKPVPCMRLDHIQYALADINGWIYRQKLMSLADWMVPHILLEDHFRATQPL